jgi:hypothetical protein
MAGRTTASATDRTSGGPIDASGLSVHSKRIGEWLVAKPCAARSTSSSNQSPTYYEITASAGLRRIARSESINGPFCDRQPSSLLA